MKHQRLRQPKLAKTVTTSSRYCKAARPLRENIVAARLGAAQVLHRHPLILLEDRFSVGGRRTGGGRRAAAGASAEEEEE